MKNKIDKIFDNLNTFRQLPSYQLERRADIFFSLYLTEALSAKTGEKIKEIFIPEFPVRKGTINPSLESNQSDKIDYVCFSEDLKKVYFVELKTDQGSVNEKQLCYLQDSKNLGIYALIEGIQQIYAATNAKNEYLSVFKLMKRIGLIKYSVKAGKVTSYTPLLPKKCKPFIVYISPKQTEDKYNRIDFCIDFEEFSKTVSKHKDEISKCFVESLGVWGKRI